MHTKGVTQMHPAIGAEFDISTGVWNQRRHKIWH